MARHGSFSVFGFECCNPNLCRRSTVAASVTTGRALRHAKGSARGLLHRFRGHCPEDYDPAGGVRAAHRAGIRHGLGRRADHHRDRDRTGHAAGGAQPVGAVQSDRQPGQPRPGGAGSGALLADPPRRLLVADALPGDHALPAEPAVLRPAHGLSAAPHSVVRPRNRRRTRCGASSRRRSSAFRTPARRS